MSFFGHKPPFDAAHGRELAEIGAIWPDLYDRFETGDNLGSAAGSSSHLSVAQRQNRYPSPLRGFNPIPVEPPQFFCAKVRVFARAIAEKLQKSSFVIELHRLQADGMRSISTSAEKGKRACKRNSDSLLSRACSRSAPVGKRYWNKACWVQGQGPAQPSPWAATSRAARFWAQASTSSAKTQPTANAPAFSCKNHVTASGRMGRARFFFVHRPVGRVGANFMGT